MTHIRGVEHHHPDCRCGKCRGGGRLRRSLGAGALSGTCCAALLSLGVMWWVALIAGVALVWVVAMIDGFAEAWRRDER